MCITLGSSIRRRFLLQNITLMKCEWHMGVESDRWKNVNPGCLPLGNASVTYKRPRLPRQECPDTKTWYGTLKQSIKTSSCFYGLLCKSKYTQTVCSSAECLIVLWISLWTKDHTKTMWGCSRNIQWTMLFDLGFNVSSNVVVVR